MDNDVHGVAAESLETRVDTLERSVTDLMRVINVFQVAARFMGMADLFIPVATAAPHLGDRGTKDKA